MELTRFLIPLSSNCTTLMTSLIRLIARTLIVLPFLPLIGCGNSEEVTTIIVKGRLTENGRPFILDQAKIPIPKGATAAPPGGESGIVRIAFIPTERTEQFPAKYVAESGTFEVSGTHGKGIKPGRYKIVITAGHTPGGKVSGDYFGGKFSREQTQIIREVKAGEEIAIDVAKPQG